MRWWWLCLIFTGCTPKSEVPKDLAGFSEISRRTLEIKGAAGLEVRYRSGSSEAVIRSLSGVNPSAFDKAVELREFELAQPFRAERSPYPGAVTDTVQCPGKFRPRVKKSDGEPRLWRAETFATARKSVACGDPEFAMKGVELIYYCARQRKLVTVNAYFAKENVRPVWGEWLSTAACEN